MNEIDLYIAEFNKTCNCFVNNKNLKNEEKEELIEKIVEIINATTFQLSLTHKESLECSFNKIVFNYKQSKNCLMFLFPYYRKRYYKIMGIAQQAKNHLAILHRNYIQKQQIEENQAKTHSLLLKNKVVDQRELLDELIKFMIKFSDCFVENKNLTDDDKEEIFLDVAKIINHLTIELSLKQKENIEYYFNEIILKYKQNRNCLMFLFPGRRKRYYEILDIAKRTKNHLDTLHRNYIQKQEIEEEQAKADAILLAIKNRDLRLLKQLINKKTVNLADKDGTTPIMEAVKQGDHQFIEFLIQAGADVSLGDKQGFTSLDWAIIKKRTLCAFLLKNTGKIDEKVYQEYISRVYLANMWGIKGTSTLTNKLGRPVTFELEGFREGIFLSLLASPLNNLLFKQLKDKKLNLQKKLLIKEAFEHAGCVCDCSTQEVLKKIRNKQPVILSLNIDSHLVNIVFFENQMAICNRGQGMTAHAIEIFKISESDITESIIYSLMDIETVDELNAEIKEMVEEEDLEYSDSLDQKKQKIGNCVKASTTAALLVLLYFLTDKNKAKAFSLYKSLTLHLRLDALTTHFIQDKKLLKKINKKKLKKTSPAYLLKKRVLHAIGDKEIVLEAVKGDGSLLQYVSKQLKDDEEIVKIAIQFDPEVLQHASPRLQEKFKA